MDRQQSRVGTFIDTCMDKGFLPATVAVFSAGALSTLYGLYNIATADVMEPLAPYTKEATIGGPILMGLGGIAIAAAAVRASRNV